MKEPSRETEVCERTHPHIAQRIKSEVERLPNVSELFRVLGDDTRSRIVYALSKEEVCVCALAEILGITTQAVSYHLRLLRAHRLVKSRKEGKMVFYSLDDDHVVSILEEAVAHLSHS